MSLTTGNTKRNILMGGCPRVSVAHFALSFEDMDETINGDQFREGTPTEARKVRVIHLMWK